MDNQGTPARVWLPGLLLAFLLLAGCGAQLRRPVTVPEIIQMSKRGVPSGKIISDMRESQTIYRLKASQLADLREMGVSDEVIDYMQHTYLYAVSRNLALEDWGYWWPGWDGYWYGGPSFGWPAWGGTGDYYYSPVR